MNINDLARRIDSAARAVERRQGVHYDVPEYARGLFTQDVLKRLTPAPELDEELRHVAPKGLST